MYNSDDDEEINLLDTAKPSMSFEAMYQLFSMRKNETLCDAIIRLDDNSTFRVHRAILCACSAYFKAIFTTSLNNQKNDVTIKGIKKDTMEKIIKYAYLRECDITNENVFEIYAISDYVGIIGLIKLCVNFMIDNMRPENCVLLMLFGRGRFNQKLYTAARNYLLINFTQVISDSNQLLSLSIDDFHNIINDEMLNVRDEEPVWECCLRWINHDPQNRRHHIKRLMEAVRLGLLNTSYFMERVKDHPYVASCEEARPIVINVLKFLYDLDAVTQSHIEAQTPALALPRLPHEVIFAIGGWSEGLPQTYIETYDTRADRWVRVKEEDEYPRAYHGTAVIGHNIYCIGGFDGVEYFNTCRAFNAVKKKWREIAPMHIPRCYVSVTVLDGYIYALGGYDGHSRQNTAERYNPKTNQWSLIAPMNMQRSDADACFLNGKIYITGGFNGQECLNSAEYYDPVTNVWSPLPNMISRRSGVSCVSYQNCIYVIGGFNGMSRLNTGERYNPETLQWNSIKEMYSPRSNFGLEIIDDMIFAIGGFNGIVTISHTECYVVENNEWLEATDMSIVRSALTANVVSNLPNIRDYIHKDRDKLMEERRLRLIAAQMESNTENND